MSGQALGWAWAVPGVTSSERLVLVALADYAAPMGEERQHQCYPGQESLAERACLSVRQVRRILGGLEERGIITRERRSTPEGRTSDRYWLPVFTPQPDNMSGTPTGHPGAANRTSEGGQPDISVRGITQEELPEGTKDTLVLVEPPATPAKEDRDWETFWRLYPRKVKKKDARKAWERAVDRVSSSAILSGLHAQLPDLEAREPRYVPMPATWLNGERWDDEVTIKRASGHGRRDPWR